MSEYWLNPDDSVPTTGVEIGKGPETGIAENFDANFEEFTKLNRQVSEFERLTDAYDRRIDQVETLTGKKLNNPIYRKVTGIEVPVIDRAGAGTVSPLFEAARDKRMLEFEKEVDALRLDYPALEPFEGMIRGVQQESQNVTAVAVDVGDRANLMGKIGGLAGDVAGGITDPLMAMTMFTGAAVEAGILKTALVEAGIAGATETLIQPQVQDYRDEQGLDAGVGQALENIASATFGGLVLGGAGKTLIKAFEKYIPSPTRDQESARKAYEDFLEQNEDNPFADNDAGQKAYYENLSEAQKSLYTGDAPDIKNEPIVSRAMRFSDDSSLRSFSPRDIDVDAKTFQFKEGGDADGVTERLKDVKEWDPVKSGVAMVYEYSDGRQLIADGHQRLGLAKRLLDDGRVNDIEFNAFVFREEDGYTPEMVRAIAAEKNIAEGTGSAVDAAKVFKVAPEVIEGLPPRSALVRQEVELSKLSDDAFGMVVNDIVPENYAALVGRIVNDPAVDKAVLDILAKTEPVNLVEAEAIIRQAKTAGFEKTTQGGLFGDEEIAESLFLERGRVLSKSIQQLKKDRSTFNNLVQNEGRIASQGNELNRQANIRRAQSDVEAVQILQSLANRKGPISDALTQAARSAKNEGSYTKPVSEFLGSVRNAIKRGDYDGAEIGGNGYADEIARPYTESSGNTNVERDLLDDFAEPGSPQTSSQSDAILNDLDFEADEDLLDLEIPVGSRIDPDTDEVIPATIKARDLLQEIDEEEKFIKAIEVCKK